MVESNMQRLAKQIYETEPTLAMELLVRSRTHDVSKLKLVEFEHLWKDNPFFADALKHHHMMNDHHPEYFGSIHKMHEPAIAEMVCDCVARGNEFGTDVREWFATEATERYNFKMTDPVGVKISKYLDLVLTPKFTVTCDQ